MTQEIVEAVRDIEREKGIEGGTLVAALEDALLAAYKKMPEAARHAIVEIDDHGDFRVYAVELPPDIEERLIDRRGSANSRSSRHSRSRPVSVLTPSSPTTTSTSTGPRFRRARSSARTSRRRTSGGLPRRRRSR